MPLGPLHSDFANTAKVGRPEDRTKVRRLGTPSSPFARHHRAGSVVDTQESRMKRSLRSFPRKGLITPAELRRTLSRTAAAPAFPMPGTGVPDTSKGGSHDPYQASPVPPVRWPSQPLDEHRPWRHSACARALAPGCGDTRAFSHVPHRARPETAPSHSLARSYTCMGPARPPPARCPALVGLGCADRRHSDIH